MFSKNLKKNKIMDKNKFSDTLKSDIINKAYISEDVKKDYINSSLLQLFVWGLPRTAVYIYRLSIQAVTQEVGLAFPCPCEPEILNNKMQKHAHSASVDNIFTTFWSQEYK